MIAAETSDDAFGPLRALSTPGHAPDHLTFLAGRAALTGDAVLGEGSVFIAPDPGAMASYLEGLEKLRSFILPGGTPGSALLHVSRTVVRRAERSTSTAIR